MTEANTGNSPVASKDGWHLVIPGDFLGTLENCEGHYACPTGPAGEFLGPIVGYAASYEPGENGKKWVGLEYFNFSQADQWPAVLTAFANQASFLLTKKRIEPDVIIGAPWAGVKFSQAVAFAIGCRQIFAEKEVVGFDDKGKRIEKLILGRYEGMIRPGDKVVIGEELVNNASTTSKLIDLVEAAGGKVIAVMCAINRSYPFKATFWDAPVRDPIPIVGVIERSTPQYRQDDPVVAGAIATGNVVLETQVCLGTNESSHGCCSLRPSRSNKGYRV